LIPNHVLELAIGFHGHLGPFLILGLRAGLFANQVLGKDCFNTEAVVETDLKPPCSCFVDGVQVATGCTMGKRNIELIKGSGLSATFTKGERKIRIELKRNLLIQLLSDNENNNVKSVAHMSTEHFANIFYVIEAL